MGDLSALDFTQLDLSNLNPTLLLIVVSLAGAAIPLAILALSSFIKLNIVFSILRNAIGGQNIPPASLVFVLSFVLTLQIMAPVWLEIGTNLNHFAFSYSSKQKLANPRELETAQTTSPAKYGLKAKHLNKETSSREKERESIRPEDKSALTVSKVLDALHPLKRFLELNSNSRERKYFANQRASRLKSVESNGGSKETQIATGLESSVATTLPKDGNPISTVQPIEGEDFSTLVPAFILTEVSEAFAIGFIVYLPFLVIDLVVANILLSLGMMMINPATISLPAKLILFVLCEGWLHLIQGLIQGYAF